MNKDKLTYPKSKRLRKKSDFTDFFKKASRVDNRFLRIFHSEASQETGKWAFGINRKIGIAVKRNKIKRQLKDIMRQHQHQINKKTTLYISCKSGISRLSYQELNKSITSLLKQKDILS